MNSSGTGLATHVEQTWHAEEVAAAIPVDLLIEVPHGATRGSDFHAVREHLTGPMPDDLEAFYFVNTDVGAPEAAEILAERLTRPADSGPAVRSVRLLRGLVPRTFADVNRVLTAHDQLHSEGWNPAVPDYIRGTADRALLSALHRDYDTAALRAHDAVCGAGGLAIILHSYAPRSVGVTVDDEIVPALRRAYAPDLYSTWPERPVIEAITEMADGRDLTEPELVAAIAAHYEAAGIRFATNETYRLHPATSGTVHALRWPNKTLSIELNRGHLVPEFIPFVELATDRDAITRLVTPLATSLCSHLGRRPRPAPES